MLLNTLSPDNEKYEKLDADLEKIRQNDLEKLKIDDQKMAFSEDKIARGMRIFEQRQKKLDFETAIQYQFDQIVSIIFWTRLKKIIVTKHLIGLKIDCLILWSNSITTNECILQLGILETATYKIVDSIH